jgi:hypothetical protein
MHAVQSLDRINQAPISTIRVDGSAAFQLLLFARQDAVRDAAAKALHAFAQIPADLLRAHDCDFMSLPLAERVAAQMVASVFDQSGCPRTLTGWRPHRDYSRTPPCPAMDSRTRVFQLTAGMRPRWEGGRRLGVPSYHYMDTFVLPCEPEDLFAPSRLRLCCAGSIDLGDEREIRLRFGLRRALSRGVTDWNVPVLVDANGRVQCELPLLPRTPLLTDIRLDGSTLLRLASGGCVGSIIVFRREPRASRRNRCGRFVGSIELGDLDERKPLFVGFMGESTPCLDAGERLQLPAVEMPVLGGATIDCLDAIARRVGVLHGGFLRGSFRYHPLGSPSARTTTSAAEVA